MTNLSSNIDLSRLTIENKTTKKSSEAGRGWRLFSVLLIAALTGTASFFIGRISTPEHELVKTKASPTPSSSQTGSITSVNTIEPSIKNEDIFKAPQTLAATGYVVAQRKAAVSAKATGRLRELNVAEGDRVKQGQVIGVIENDDLRALYDQALAGVKSAQAQIKFAQAELIDSERQKSRVTKLTKDRVVSQADFDTGDARLDKANASLEMANANLLLSEAQAQKARIDLDNSWIRAPFDATVLNKNADIGEIVTPFGSGADARAAIVTIADMSSLEVEADVSESNISKVKIGQSATITLDSFPEHRYQGQVKSVVPTVDRAKATVMVRIKFLNIDERVIPEMSAKISFELKGVEP